MNNTIFVLYSGNRGFLKHIPSTVEGPANFTDEYLWTENINEAYIWRSEEKANKYAEEKTTATYVASFGEEKGTIKERWKNSYIEGPVEVMRIELKPVSSSLFIRGWKTS